MPAEWTLVSLGLVTRLWEEQFECGSLEDWKLEAKIRQPSTNQSFLASKVNPMEVPTSGVLRT
jgi:hypothetical protein